MVNPTPTFREVTAQTWADFEALFEAPGGPKSCWCTVWRPDVRRDAKGPQRKSAMKDRVDRTTPIGILGYLDGAPVCWCSIAPRSTFRNLGGALGHDEDGANVWSLTCIYVRRALRGEGLSRQIVDAAVRHAHENGATIVEAYPVDPDSPSYRFMGFVSVFLESGFREVGRAGTRRHVMRMNVAGKGDSSTPSG